MRKRDHEYYLKRAVKLSEKAGERGNQPFGAVLVDDDGEILLEQENVELTESDCTGHAETALVRRASKQYSRDFLWDCTIYASAEPCLMCAGAIFKCNIGRVVFGISGENLRRSVGGPEAKPDFDLSCKEILKGSKKDIEVFGPFEKLEKEILKPIRKYRE